MEMYPGELESAIEYIRWAWGNCHAGRLYPWDEGREQLMLFNENVVNLFKHMRMGREDYLSDILA